MSISPNPRKGACIVLIQPFFFIFGGLTASGLSNELWVYNMQINSFTLLYDGSDKGPKPVYKSSCTVDFSIDDYVFYAIFGTGNHGITDGDI